MSQRQDRPKLVDDARTATLWCLITELEESLLPEFIPLVSNINRLITSGWTFYVVAQQRGRCYYDRKTITIPVWAMKRSEDFTTYYLAHEVAHALDNRKHDEAFMRSFMFLCPSYLQHFEINYKPQAAMAAGIMPEDF